MKDKLFCPVCEVSFILKNPLKKGDTVVCPVCGAKLVVDGEEPLSASRFPQPPLNEIVERIDNYAQLKGYIFKENKQEIIDGLLAKNERYGDFFCPCRFDNIQENVCPCKETRQGYVNREGSCL
ncbi:ferredoxin-thioredoxin reductase catalytic domain-containing protein [Dehalobacterium formicoaceticum]|uniref:Ferredoxin:thioredoxin reductase n=1 Tax=Dehalobacterium formicoaceticum TaxID=51515 RepID=A0ABT1Y0M4_9FIRM|nr:ferredoxin-thioredoxin reductase catalytic domain-containing protein [Dehalobacterium formicoaceticum]MCR6544424.1 hypothetical protein [Dehalobacterium formicoaceticum]